MENLVDYFLPSSYFFCIQMFPYKAQSITQRIPLPSLKRFYSYFFSTRILVCRDKQKLTEIN